MGKTFIASIMIFFMMTSITLTAFASWHWSSPWEVCGTEVIKKGEKCDLRESQKGYETTQHPNQMKKYFKNYCDLDLKPIKKITTDSIKCVKESSYEKLIQRGWGISVGNQ